MSLVKFDPVELPPTLHTALDTSVAGVPQAQWWTRQSAELQKRFADAVRMSVSNGETLAQATTRIVGGTVNGVSIPGVMKTTRARASANG